MHNTQKLRPFTQKVTYCLQDNVQQPHIVSRQSVLPSPLSCQQSMALFSLFTCKVAAQQFNRYPSELHRIRWCRQKCCIYNVQNLFNNGLPQLSTWLG